jgi:DNA-binding NarL/FixJ family response regulator
MKYIKATEALPAELVDEIRKYAEGCVIYISNAPGTHRRWGETTETRAAVESRNVRMLSDRLSGLSILKIAEKYHLAESTVKKIVYKK